MAAGVDQVGGYPQAAVRRWRASDRVGVRGGEVEVQYVVSLRAQADVRRRDICDVTRRALVAWDLEAGGLGMRSHGFSFLVTAYRQLVDWVLVVGSGVRWRGILVGCVCIRSAAAFLGSWMLCMVHVRERVTHDSSIVVVGRQCSALQCSA